MTQKPVLRPTVPTSAARPLVSPIQPAVVYTTETPDALDALYEGQATGFTYSREGHPNASSLAKMIDNMEDARNGIVVSSGMAAVVIAVLTAAKAGDHVLGGNQLYGRSLRMMNEELPRLGMETSLFDPTDLAALEQAIRPNTRVILVEVVSNPTLRVADMEGIIALAKSRGIKVIVDNTFTTPRAYQPLTAGADFVVHSVTKLLAGHSDALLGYVAAADAEDAERLYVIATTWGFTACPWSCWTAERGMLTFDLRFAQAQRSAAAIAEALKDSGTIERVIYPGDPSHPDHNRARTLLGEHAGNMVSFQLKGNSREVSNAFAQAAAPLAFAPTLGDVATTISHPASSSHRALTVEARQTLGMGETFFRVSVGVEPTDMLIETLVSAAKTATQA
ncbi:trans-sulfuration enzyme family protein [Shimia ponticola]|uniref:trans-sulfuration enzyme family protein n=1 Tax=Shimia ponticola TaxID=2582893 RepID=UPI0011BE86AF|nr:aminotransferase class I/II-fold pyridoxal phosphate-dependent enzyme [Shimia ponticola]